MELLIIQGLRLKTEKVNYNYNQKKFAYRYTKGFPNLDIVLSNSLHFMKMYQEPPFCERKFPAIHSSQV